MNCNEYEHLVTEYLEGTASPSQRVRMESHLAECKKCHTLAAREKSVMELLKSVPLEACPDEVINRVMESISTPGMSFKERIRKWLQPGLPMRFGFSSLLGFLAVAVMLLAIFLPGHQKQILEAQKYSPEEVQQATVEAKLALAYFSVYSRKAETTLEKIDLGRPVMKPIEGEFKKALGKIPYI